MVLVAFRSRSHRLQQLPSGFTRPLGEEGQEDEGGTCGWNAALFFSMGNPRIFGESMVNLCVLFLRVQWAGKSFQDIGLVDGNILIQPKDEQ
jgi:hypothetical protein